MIPGVERSEPKTDEGADTRIAHLMKLRPIHSTWAVTTTRADALLAHVTHVRVLMLKTPPLGTSGVRVVVSIEMYRQSNCEPSRRGSQIWSTWAETAVQGFDVLELVLAVVGRPKGQSFM